MYEKHIDEFTAAQRMNPASEWTKLLGDAIDLMRAVEKAEWQICTTVAASISSTAPVFVDAIASIRAAARAEGATGAARANDLDFTTLRAVGRAEGYAEGYEAGKSDASAEWVEGSAALAGVCRDLSVRLASADAEIKRLKATIEWLRRCARSGSGQMMLSEPAEKEDLSERLAEADAEIERLRAEIEATEEAP